jgi:hypothetical protein
MKEQIIELGEKTMTTGTQMRTMQRFKSGRCRVLSALRVSGVQQSERFPTTGEGKRAGDNNDDRDILSVDCSESLLAAR